MLQNMPWYHKYIHKTEHNHCVRFGGLRKKKCKKVRLSRGHEVAKPASARRAKQTLNSKLKRDCALPPKERASFISQRND